MWCPWGTLSLPKGKSHSIPLCPYNPIYLWNADPFLNLLKPPYFSRGFHTLTSLTPEVSIFPHCWWTSPASSHGLSVELGAAVERGHRVQLIHDLKIGADPIRRIRFINGQRPPQFLFVAIYCLQKHGYYITHMITFYGFIHQICCYSFFIKKMDTYMIV